MPQPISDASNIETADLQLEVDFATVVPDLQGLLETGLKYQHIFADLAISYCLLMIT